MNGFSWQSRKWSLLTAIVVMAAVGGLMWWLVGGCETKPEPDPAEKTAAEARDRSYHVMQAMSDQNVIELAFRIACFYHREKRLPASLDELKKSAAGAVAPLPTSTTRGQALEYKKTGERTYTLAFTRERPGGQPETVTIPEEVPAAMPALDDAALRVWWDLEYYKRMAQELQGRMNTADTSTR
jgi:hypothetical protein